MTSQARIDANRQNARLSTGPRTEEGKQASSRNATKHGLFACLIPLEEPAFHDLLAGLCQALQPADEFQKILVEQIGISYIRLARLYERELRSQTQEEPSPLFLRYEAMLTRQIDRNIKLLNRPTLSAHPDKLASTAEAAPVVPPACAPSPPAPCPEPGNNPSSTIEAPASAERTDHRAAVISRQPTIGWNPARQGVKESFESLKAQLQIARRDERMSSDTPSHLSLLR